VAYHYVIQPGGKVDSGRPPERIGAHCLGENNCSIGICLVGRRKFTQAQFASLRGLIQAVARRYSMEPTAIYCHREFASAKAQGKTCPNIDPEELRAWVLDRDESAITRYLLG
jgi:N-acetyl-anhydromuramyl-L-alanine amidase AmpD